MIKNKNRIYWLLQILGWGGYTSFLTFFLTSFSDNSLPVKVILLQIVIGSTLFFVSHQMRILIKQWNWVDLKLKYLFPRILILAAIGSVIGQVIIHGIMITVLDWESYRPIRWAEFPFYAFNTFVMLLGWSVLYFGYHFFESAQKSKMDKLKAESLVKDAELIALKAQINPHFIFNSLNNIRAMVLEDPMKARDMISNLSDLMRYSIKFSNDELVSLESEIEIVENYLKLEMVQYENRLEYSLDIDHSTKELKIPPMIIQLQVENAIKHGISQLPKGGQVNVKTELKNTDLIIKVSNSGKITKNSDGGIGLKNVIERIKHLFNVEPNFSLSEKDGEVTSLLTFPAK